MIYNIAAYKFIPLDSHFLTELKNELLSKTKDLLMKGTILLSPEGINLFLAGDVDSIKFFQNSLQDFSYFKDITYKYSYSARIPFKKLIIKIRKEIIPCNDSVKPYEETASYISPRLLREWLTENKDMLILDTRNQFEFEQGHFTNAKHLGLNHFRQFNEAVKRLPEEYKNKPVVTYCTGGIRCEKAAIILRKQGFKQVYQLEGGILNFFEHCGNDYYEGNCFVFDDRIALDAKLNPIEEDRSS